MWRKRNPQEVVEALPKVQLVPKKRVVGEVALKVQLAPIKMTRKRRNPVVVEVVN